MTDNIQPKVAHCQQLIVASKSRTIQPMVAQLQKDEFSRRLHILLDAANAPSVNEGRARWFNRFINKNLKLNLSYESTRKWLTAQSIPVTTRLGPLAKALNTSVEYLIGETEIKYSTSEHNNNNVSAINDTEVNQTKHGNLSEREKYLLDLFEELDSAQQDHVLSSCVVFIDPIIYKKIQKKYPGEQTA